MKFLDHTGHIFELPSYDIYPTGYEYETFDYTFNFEDDYNARLSINNYYIKPIRFIVEEGYNDIEIISDSNVFGLLSSKIIQEKIKESGLVFEIDEDIFSNHLTTDDFIYIKEDDLEGMVWFYGIVYTNEPVTWSSNIMIHVNYDDRDIYCPICLAATFYDEQEELIINGKNMGVSFPKDITRAVYHGSMFNESINEDLYNEKVKEYLLNYMKLKGECGNLNQAINGLKFFGWGDKAKLTKLVRTDNEVINQYVRDTLDINNDLLYRFDNFKTSGLLSINVPVNAETGESETQDFTKTFWGEGKPILEDLFNKFVTVTYDECDIDFYRPYFDFMFIELGLKLSALRYFYQKYFLPLHSMLQSASLSHQVFTPDIKYFVKDFEKITEVPILMERKYGEQYVEFPAQKIQYIYTQEHYIDNNLNEFSHYKNEAYELDEHIWYINDLCISIPIKFYSDNDSIDFWDCHLILERNGRRIWETDFNFSKEQTPYENFVIVPKVINNSLTMNYWENKTYAIHLLANGKWYDYVFELRVPELNLTFGKLEYEYRNEFKQLRSITDDHIEFNTEMILPSLVSVNNINFPQNVIDYTNDDVLTKFVSLYRESPSIPHPNMSGQMSSKYYNRVHYYKLMYIDKEDIIIDGETHPEIMDDKDAWKAVPFVEYNDDVESKFYGLQNHEDIVKYYRMFFKDNGELKDRFIKNKNDISYDLYLMHDAVNPLLYLTSQEPNIIKLDEDGNSKKWQPIWYIVLISKETIDHKIDSNDLIAPEFDYIIIGDRYYKLQYFATDDKWLINRMKYISKEGINHFSKDDIIAGTVNNVDLPFILTRGTKWHISPFSLGMENDAEVESTTNTFLMSLGGDNIGYEPGYYNITVNYSLDGETQNIREHRARILIEKSNK